ncbi:mycothiol synthase [Arthrobacter crusticola]|uniref:Mycothiol acetyltransferase n=1 Tax=Arthrobacter crusticola TaxID=2547960 RepID=A0A4R5TX02_9MICC|nr:mycothiol synthase [Arthrobacter crusticola]TDK25628.1 mycothiol synthase [Arthrobacter crusticola]
MTADAQLSPWTITRTSGTPQGPLLAEIRELAARAAEADGNPPLSEQTLVNLRSSAPGAARVMLFTARPRAGSGGDAGDDAELAGVAVVSLPPGGAPDAGQEAAVLELVVAPDARAEGAGSALAAAVAAEKVPGLRAWSHGNHAAAAALAARHGFRPVRELWRMRQTRAADAELVPSPALPDKVRLRTFVPGQDEQLWLEANRSAFAHHPEQGSTTLADLQARMAEDWFDPGGFFLAEDTETSRLLGFHWTKVHAGTGAHPPLGEVYVVGVTPEAQGRGLGKALTVAGIEYLHRRGLQAIMLYVDADNTAAVALYRRLGFTRWDVDVMYAGGEDTPSL